MSNQLEELKAKLAEKAKANKERLATLIEAKKIELEITKLDSEYFTKQQIIQADIDSLNTIITLIEEKQSKHNKKLRRTFGLGEIPSLILTIAQNVMYSKLEDRDELLTACQMPTNLIETLVESLGRSAYFNPKELVIEPEVQYDLTTLKNSIRFAYVAMQLVSEPDLSKITESNFEARFKSARLSAEEVLANTVKYLNTDEVIDYTKES